MADSMNCFHPCEAPLGLSPRRFTARMTPTRSVTILVIAVLALVAAAIPCDGQPRAIDPKRSTVTVRVFKSGLFRAFADDHLIEAPLAEGTLDDSAMPAVHIAIDVRSMR